MTSDNGTAAQVLAAARALFAEHGYHGTSVRAITQAARVNLGAITYHFGSKQGLYEAALGSVFGPTADHLARAVDVQEPALDRIERFLRGMFDYVRQQPELPRMLAHHLAASLPLPAVARDTMRRNLGLLADLIALGQQEGTIRAGDPRLLALSVIAQPIFLALAGNLLKPVVSLDQTDERVHAEVRDSVVRFARSGLARPEHS
jgi:TetR/AcrR family transcriptional regulator